MFCDNYRDNLNVFKTNYKKVLFFLKKKKNCNLLEIQNGSGYGFLISDQNQRQQKTKEIKNNLRMTFSFLFPLFCEM